MLSGLELACRFNALIEIPAFQSDTHKSYRASFHTCDEVANFFGPKQKKIVASFFMKTALNSPRTQTVLIVGIKMAAAWRKTKNNQVVITYVFKFILKFINNSGRENKGRRVGYMVLIIIKFGELSKNY